MHCRGATCCSAIYKYALDHLPKSQAGELYRRFVQFEKQLGDREGIEVSAAPPLPPCPSTRLPDPRGGCQHNKLQQSSNTEPNAQPKHTAQPHTATKRKTTPRQPQLYGCLFCAP